ncbi:MAG: BatA domain-containing protein [Planctomycetia bacterium]
MPMFDFPALVWWGLPLVAAPVIIHLINLLRHRQVRWAAMEFLLASQRKYRTRVLLKQILLLCLRVAAVLGVVLALAQPRWQHALGQLLGGGRTSHVVLLDDSYSMGDLSAGDSVGETSAFDRGRLVVERIGGELAAASGGHDLTLGRWSSFGRAADDGPPRFDLDREPVAPAVVQRLRDELARLACSQTDADPHGALAAALEALGSGSAAAKVLWLVSDFRAKDWKTADETADLLRRIAAAGVELRLVDCAADGTPGNLSIERLEVAGGVPATGVVLPIDVTVRNDSDHAVRGVPVDLREDGAERPGVRIDEIPAGGVAVQRFDVRFPKSGSHVIDARLAADAVPADNLRSTVVDVADRIDVLVIDGDPQGGSRTGDAFYLATALAPGAGAPTGLRPRIEAPRALATLDLSAFDCVWLLDVAQFDPPEVAALEAYAQGGGGVVFFGGPRTKVDVVQRTLHRAGAGLYPVPLAGPVDLGGVATADGPDVRVEDHPVVAVLSGQRNPLLDAVRIERYLAVERGYEPPAGDGLRRLLSLRNGAPLVVERPFGAGLVVAVLSTAAPVWNNWARGNPSWVVVMLELESHLAAARRRASALEVGAPLEVVLESGGDAHDVDVLVPPLGTLVHQTADVGSDGRLTARLSTPAAGAYVARWKRLDGTERERAFAVNVAPDEGRLERIGRDRLDRALAGIPYRYDTAAALDPASGTLAGVSLVHPLLYALLAILVIEQFVSYSASYHMPARRPAP